MNRLTLGLLATFVAILLASGLLAFVLRDRPAGINAPAAQSGNAASSPNAAATPAVGTENQNKRGSHPLLWELFGPDSSGLSPATYASWESTAARILLRFSLAAFLAALLAFRPRRGVSFSRRNPYVAQTQILMAVVAGAMMMVVGDSAARAFGIFAAASLVRFRTNIRDPKEITVLLICLGVGLAAGVGRWDMAVILTLFVLLSLAILEYFEQSQVFRSMEVCVETRNVEQTNEVLKKVFAQHGFDAELRELNREDEQDPMGKIVYLVNLNTVISTSQLSEEILSSDRENIDSVEWDQKESSTYIYR
ncbi:MAG TPA: DUF4956 domain-containing protein [Pyrinomonadaceae bacterium]|nr:DUF4956 domain-containing protein [Pyrinomonadaceae bacterium]